MVRSQRVAQLRFQPFHYQPATGSLQVAERIKVRVTYPAGTELSVQAANPVLGSEGPFETVLENSLLNYQQAAVMARSTRREFYLPGEP